MIVDLEKLEKARVAVGITWTTLDNDNPLAVDFDWLNFLLLKVIDDLELSGECIIEYQQLIYKRGGKDGIDEGTEARSDTASSS